MTRNNRQKLQEVEVHSAGHSSGKSLPASMLALFSPDAIGDLYIFAEEAAHEVFPCFNAAAGIASRIENKALCLRTLSIKA